MQCLGKDLSSHLKSRKRFSLKTILYLIDQLIDIVNSFHLLNIIHRDIKPENIVTGMNEEQNKIFVIDFGISKSLVDSNGRHI